MRVHRSAPAGQFTVLPNSVLQFRELSYTARGLLVDLLSRPDGWREDSRQMADSSPQGRGAIRKALKELAAAGFYLAEKVRMSDGTIVTEVNVYDTPQLTPPDFTQLTPPGSTRPEPGGPDSGDTDGHIKNLDKEPSLRADASSDEPSSDEPAGKGRAGRKRAGKERVADDPALPDPQLREAVEMLFRVIRAEPRLRLGAAEARSLAPLVAQWLERGATRADLADALLPGLPVPLHSPKALLRSRLERKLPPVKPPRGEIPVCTECFDPVSKAGLCRPCAGLGPVRVLEVGRGAEVTRAGMALVREAMRRAAEAVTVDGGLLAGGVC